ncbi:L-threonylcarbamoyladenylate synthase [Pseudarthrobacter sp. fls2-241-R2A-168]|uniref:L-threonylcarbamoyladenylate synthase n=1 Tax=Pseudarthrobacter sp. fls2-241-R2A-168 TaxID=3040304 RepID=UPI002556E35A|nr:L-threonylcarbamoyladenylate synthase [Pseudarthrobacter sp. fls2-241-R2A-168]
MTTTYNCTSDDERARGLEHAQRAISEKKCVVLPTDTVYGIGADAFSPQAVTMLLVSKGRSRTMPPPVLIPRLNALDGLATDVSADARKLAEAFWPGGLTLILHAQPSLDWDLGETKGTVALRMPADDIALELLTLTGPLAVSSANRTGQAPGQTAAAAREQLAESVEVYLEGGFRPKEGETAVPSTIVDATGPLLRVVRNGAVSLDQLREHVPGVLGLGEIPMAPEELEEPVTAEASDTPETAGDSAAAGPAAAEARSAAGSSAVSTNDNNAEN